jgi:hypothetical protein
VDGDLLQLVALVEPGELAVGEGAADADGSHACSGGWEGRRRFLDGRRSDGKKTMGWGGRINRGSAINCLAGGWCLWVCRRV